MANQNVGETAYMHDILLSLRKVIFAFLGFG